MNLYVRDCLVTNYEAIIPTLTLPDPDDRHVLAAAIKGECNLIVTLNSKDFPEDFLSAYNVETRHPDDFFSEYLQHSTNEFCNAIKIIRARLKNPPMTVQQYLDNLTKQGLIKTVEILQQHADKL